MDYQDQVASIVHDAKNRLQLLLPEVDRLRDHSDLAVQASANRINRDLDDVNQQLVLMLSLYRLEQTSLVTTEEIYVTDVFESFKDRLGDPRIDIDCPQTLTVHADSRLLQAVVGDALHNALRYSDQSVVFSAHQQNDGVLVSITNDLLGRQETELSSGVGLWIANKIAESHVRGSKKGYARFTQMPAKGLFELFLP